MSRFASQFPTGEALRLNLRAQQIAPEKLRGHIRAQLRQTAWIEDNIAGGIVVSKDEVRAWFDENRERFEIPDLVRARHIFLSTVEDNTPEREELIREIHRKLVSGEADFAALALEYSEDPRTAKSGGDLNYFSPRRLAADFADLVFSLELNEPSEPFRTAIGWHIAEITDRKPARRCSFEELDGEIRHLLETKKREIAVAELIKRLHLNSVIQLYPAAFGSEVESP